MKYRFLLLISSVFFLPFSAASFRTDQRSPRGIILTLSRIYRSGDHDRLLSICNTSGKQYFSRFFRGYRLKRWKQKYRSIGRRTVNVSLVSINIQKDGSVRLGYIFDLRRGRRTVPYRESITVVKKDGLYWIRGKY